MEKIIAFCGNNCAECSAFIATQKNDDTERRRVAELWNEEYKLNLKPEVINCLGCLIESEPVFNYCKVCPIRQCGKTRNIQNCAYCADYPCPVLKKFLAQVLKAKNNLEEVRKTLKH